MQMISGYSDYTGTNTRRDLVVRVSERRKNNKHDWGIWAVRKATYNTDRVIHDSSFPEASGYGK